MAVIHEPMNASGETKRFAEDERNIALSLSYDGGRYHGWQVQKNAVTVAGTLEAALSRICNHAVRVVGCGRTDAGVSARSYCANFRTTSRIPTERLPIAVNSLLPSDIAVSAAAEVSDRFNAISSCEKKEYTYTILNSRIRDPFLAGHVCFYPTELDFERFSAAASEFEGTHDFAAVRSVGTETKTTVRTVHHCRAEKTGDLIILRICADGFLYNMARAIVGTCVYAAHGKIEPTNIPKLLLSRDRRLTGPTMPPQGLCLSRVWYGEDLNTPVKDFFC